MWDPNEIEVSLRLIKGLFFELFFELFYNGEVDKPRKLKPLHVMLAADKVGSQVSWWEDWEEIEAWCMGLSQTGRIFVHVHVEVYKSKWIYIYLLVQSLIQMVILPV